MPLYFFKTQYIVLSGAQNINDKPFMASNSRPRNVACNLQAKGCYDWFCPVPGALLLSRDESRWKKDFKKRSSRLFKVENCRYIKDPFFKVTLQKTWGCRPFASHAAQTVSAQPATYHCSCYRRFNRKRLLLFSIMCAIFVFPQQSLIP